jgi:hypothetical protein
LLLKIYFTNKKQQFAFIDVGFSVKAMMPRQSRFRDSGQIIIASRKVSEMSINVLPSIMAIKLLSALL